MCPSNDCEINVDWRGQIVTRECAALILNGIIKFFLYQRNQIPLPFPTFESIVKNWQNNDSADDTWDTINLQRHRQIAKNTYNKIKEVENVIFEASKSSNIIGGRILFGSTALTPKEVFVINLPSVSAEHSFTNHNCSLQKDIKAAILPLVTSPELQKAFPCQNLPPTNVFFDIFIQKSTEPKGLNHFDKKYDFDLPTKCKKATINMIKSNITVPLNCCKNLQVFDASASLTDVDKQCNEGSCDSSDSQQLVYLECKTFVKGFKDVIVNGKSIWTD